MQRRTEARIRRMRFHGGTAPPTYHAWRAAARIFSAILLLSLTACSAISLFQSPRERAAWLAERNGWQPQTFDAAPFVLHGYHPPYSRNHPELAVYIEGDGRGWVTRTDISDDPTPNEPLTLELAIADPSPNRLYLARPCQYAPAAELARCDPKYWTSHRYAPEIVAALNAAIDQAERDAGATRLRVFGYSGGGALAVLIAARRTNVVQIVTVAGNLDHVAWTKLRGDSPLTGSLNAADAADAVSHIPQVHFIGADDDVVPASVAESYRRRARDPSRIALIKVPEMSHTCCWAETWPTLLRRYVYR